MPVNMDPSKKRRRTSLATSPAHGNTPASAVPPAPAFGEETEADREKALADAECKSLWDATEVIDVDKV